MGQRISAIAATILKAITLAMGVAVVILNTMGAATIETSITLLSFGLLAIGLASFIGVKEID